MDMDAVFGFRFSPFRFPGLGLGPICRGRDARDRGAGSFFFGVFHGVFVFVLGVLYPGPSVSSQPQLKSGVEFSTSVELRSQKVG